MLIFGLKGRIDDYYQKDFVNINIISEQLVWDIEKTYGKKFPPVELNIRLSEKVETGIRYKDNSKILQLFLPSRIMDFNSNQKRAYLAHEFGHYVLGHLDHQNPLVASFFGIRDLDREIEADSFTLKFSSPEDLSLDIKILIWDENEKKARIDALSEN